MTSLEDSDEDYLDPIQLMDFEQKRISNQFNKTNPEEYDQADSEGELFIQKTNNNQKKNCFRNQSARTTITLPVTFFDIAQNVQYLSDCRPLFVKIVDCDKHPWYYKKYLSSDKKRDDEVVDVGVEDYFQPYSNKNNGLNSSVNSEDMQKLKIRPVETPYERLKNSNTMAKPVSLIAEKPLKDWHKLIKQKAIDQRNDLQVDFKKNLGLIGLKISHTTETIKTPKKNHKHSKKDKHKSKTKRGAKSKTVEKHSKRVLAKLDNALSPAKSATSNFIKQQNSEVLPVKSTPPNLINHPGSMQESTAKNISTSKQVSDRLNLTASGSVNLGKLPENVVNPDNNVPTGLRQTALVDTLSKNLVTASLCKISQSSDGIPASSVSTSTLKLSQNEVTPATTVPTSLLKQPVLSVTSPKNLSTNLPKPSESLCKLSSVPISLSKQPDLTVTPCKNVSSAILTRPPYSTDNTNKNNCNLVQSHFFTEVQSGEQNITHTKDKPKRSNEVQQQKPITDSNSTQSNENNKTLVSLLNKKVLHYQKNTDQKNPSDMNVQKEPKSDKTKKTCKEAKKSNLSGNRKNKNILNMKVLKPRKKEKKNEVSRFTEFKETFLNGKKGTEGTSFTKAKETLNSTNVKIKVAHPINAGVLEPAKLQDERKQKVTVGPEKSPTTPAYGNDKKVNLLSSKIVDKAVIEDIVAKCKKQKMAMAKENSKCQLNFANPSSSVAQNCKSQNSTAQSGMVAPALQVDQNAVNSENQKTTNFISSPPSSFQIQREHMPAILNELRGPWVPTSQMSSHVNNSVINNNMKQNQNTYNGQKTSKISCINVTISTSPCVPQASLQSTTAQMSMNTYTKLPDTGKVPKITNEQQRQSLQSTYIMKMGENIKTPCCVNGQSQTKENTKMIAVRRKSVPALGEHKLLEVCDNLMRLANNDHSDKVTPQRMFRPASTFNVAFNQTTPAPPPADLEPYSPNYSYQQYHPVQTLVNPRKNLQDNLQTGVNQWASHLQHSQMLSNLNAAAQQIMPQQNNSQQCHLGKLGAKAKQSRSSLLTKARQSAMPNTQPIAQPTAVVKTDELGHTLWIGDPRQQAIQHQLPPTCDVAPPYMGNNPQHLNGSLHPQTSLKPPNFNTPPPTYVPTKHVLKQGMVSQPIPVLHRGIQPGCGPVMYQHFRPNNFPAGVHNNQPLQHRAYSKQYVQQNRAIDYSNDRHCAPIYVGIPQNLPMNTIPYEMKSARSCYYPDMTMPPPPSPFTPHHNIKQSAGYGFIDPNRACNQLPQKSVTGTTVIGCNDTGLVRKINIHSATVDMNDKQDPINEIVCNDNKTVPLESDTEKPVASKKEMMEELSRVTAIISPPRSPIKDYGKVQSQNNSVRGNSSIREDKNLNISTVKDNLDNERSPKTSSLKRTIAESNFSTTPVTNNIVCKDFSINKNPKHSPRNNTSFMLKSTQNSSTLEMEKSNQLVSKASVFDTESKKPTPNIEKSVNNNILTSSIISHNENFIRPHSQLDNISEPETSQTLIRRPKPGPLSRKPRYYDSVLKAQMSVDPNPVALKGYSPPILPIPSYTKSLEILAKSNLLESERRNPVNFAEHQFKEPKFINAVGILQPTQTGSNKDLTEEEKEQQEKAVKKISLDEYKKRVSQTDGSKQDVRDFNVDKIKIKIKNENSDQDLGYDSDSTMRV